MNQLTKWFLRSSVGLAFIALLSSSSFAVAGQLTGTWKMQSLTREEFSDGKVTETPPAPAKGEIVFTSEGRYLVAIFAQQCAPSGDENQARSGQIMIAHAGQYRVSGEKLFQHVDRASSGALIGATQMQFIGWTGHKLVLESMPTQNVADGKSEILTLTLER